MKNFLSFLIFLLPISIFSQKSDNHIAVMELDAVGLSQNEAKIITARLRTDLFNSGKFTVLERDKMNEILDEQGFQLSGCTTNECIVEVGKLLGVRHMIAGDIGKIGSMFTITIRMIDIQTGKILKTATEDCECKIEKVLTTSVKNVAQILAGNKITTSTYSKSEQNQETLTEWDKLNISREEWVKYKRSGIDSFEEWKLENSFWKKNKIEFSTYYTFPKIPDVKQAPGSSDIDPDALVISNDLAMYFNNNVFALSTTYSDYLVGGVGLQYFYSFNYSNTYFQVGLKVGFWTSLGISKNEDYHEGIPYDDYSQNIKSAGPSFRFLYGFDHLKLNCKCDVLLFGEGSIETRFHVGFAISNR